MGKKVGEEDLCDWLNTGTNRKGGGSQQVVYYRARDKTWDLIGLGGQG